MKKKTLHTHIAESGHDIRLTLEERTRMRSVLSAYMAMKPLRGTPTPSPLTLVFFQRPLAALLVAVLFVSSAGVSYAAEGALPGDVLYTVKTKFNEPISGALALSSESKAEWAMNVASERAKEAAVLSARGTLDSTTASALRDDFDAHTQQALAVLESTEKKNPDGNIALATRFEARLSEYERIVGGLGSGQESSLTFASAVAAQKTKLADIRAKAESDTAKTEDRTSVRVALAEQLSSQAKNSVSSVTRLVRRSLPSLSEGSATELSIAVDSAQASVADGDVLLGQDATDEAVGAFTRALSVSERLRAYVETNSAIHRSTGRSLARTDARENEGRGSAPTAATMMKAVTQEPTASEVRAFSVTIDTSADTAQDSSGHATSTATTTQEEESEHEVRGEVHVRTLVPSIPPPSLDLF